MPIEICFALIPSKILWKICIKMSTSAYVKLLQTCKDINKIATVCDHVVTIYVSQEKNTVSLGVAEDSCNPSNGFRLTFPQEKNKFALFKLQSQDIRCIKAPMCIDSDLVQTLKQLVVQMPLKAKSWIIEAPMTCEQEEFKELIKVLNLEFLNVFSPIDRNVFFPEAFQKLSSLTLHSTNYTDYDISKITLKNFEIYCPQVTSVGICAIVKQWMQSKRVIERVVLFGIEPRHVDEAVHLLPCNLLYSQKVHRFSLVSSLSLDEVRFFLSGPLYIIFHPTKTLIIHPYASTFRMMECISPAGHLIRYLPTKEAIKAAGSNFPLACKCPYI